MKKNVIAMIAVVVLLLLGSGAALAQWQQAKPAATVPANMATSTQAVASSTPSVTKPAPVPPSPTTHAYGPVTLSLGQSAKFADMTITPLSIIEDSRCPLGVMCIQAGTVRVSVRIQTAAGISTETLTIRRTFVTSGDSVTLTTVDPIRGHSPIDASVYRLTFDVEKIATSSACYIGGCSSEICSDAPGAVSSCIYSSQYACYTSATCERQASGACGWTQTPALMSCLAHPDTYTL